MIKTIFYLLLITINYWIYSKIIDLQKQKECLCNSGWRIENIKMISIITILISIINLFIPLNKTLYKIPVISTFMTFGLILIIFSQLFLMLRLSRQLNTAKCQDTCDIDWIFVYIRNMTMGNIFLASVIISIGMLWI